MAFLVSPGVQVKEIDLTNVVPAVATSIGAIAGAFQKGPVSSIVNITSEEELLQIFGNNHLNGHLCWIETREERRRRDFLGIEGSVVVVLKAERRQLLI